MEDVRMSDGNYILQMKNIWICIKKYYLLMVKNMHQFQ